jgi:hypothetical protein
VATQSLKQFLLSNHFSTKAGVRRLMPNSAQGSLRRFLDMTLFDTSKLVAWQQLNVGEQLVSNNGFVNMILQSDRNIVLYRTMFGVTLWQSNTAGTTVATLLMQADGNLVAYPSIGPAIWASGTDGHPGASCVLQDDGNFVVYDDAGDALWSTNTVQDFSSPAYVYTASDSYTYDETSESWKRLCEQLPCFDALQWPDYSSTHVDATIMGQPVVIQLWKGWCQKFLGLSSFPGGVGAEVGVYRRIPGKARPTSLPFLPKALELMVLHQLQQLADNDLWWPYPELGATVEYTLINPVTNQPFFTAGPESTYWLAKWMFDDSYSRYQSSLGAGNTPTFSANYLLNYKVADYAASW